MHEVPGVPPWLPRSRCVLPAPSWRPTSTDVLLAHWRGIAEDYLWPSLLFTPGPLTGTVLGHRYIPGGLTPRGDALGAGYNGA